MLRLVALGAIAALSATPAAGVSFAGGGNVFVTASVAAVGCTGPSALHYEEPVAIGSSGGPFAVSVTTCPLATASATLHSWQMTSDTLTFAFEIEADSTSSSAVGDATSGVGSLSIEITSPLDTIEFLFENAGVPTSAVSWRVFDDLSDVVAGGRPNDLVTGLAPGNYTIAFNAFVLGLGTRGPQLSAGTATIQLTSVPVPEPSAGLLVGAGLAALAVRRRR